MSELSKYRQRLITEDVIDEYKNDYPSLKRIRESDQTYGYIYTDRNKLVALINTEDKGKEGIWIQALEVFEPYKGKGLSYDLLDVATKKIHAKYLSVRKTNRIAIHVYEKYGFKKYKEDDYMIYMKI